MDHCALIRSSAAAAPTERGVGILQGFIQRGAAVAADGPMLPSALAAFTLIAQSGSLRARLRAGTASAANGPNSPGAIAASTLVTDPAPFTISMRTATLNPPLGLLAGPRQPPRT